MEKFEQQNNNESEKNQYGFTPEEWEALDDMDREGFELAALYEEDHYKKYL